jgi:hypothetical protein
MNETAEVLALTSPDGHLQCVQRELSVQRVRDAPANDEPGEHIDHEGHIHEASPCVDVGQIRHPKCIRRSRGEVAFDQIGGPSAHLSGSGCALLLAPDDAGQIQVVHQPGYPVTSDLVALALELVPYLLDSVHAKVVAMHSRDLDLQNLVAQLPR